LEDSSTPPKKDKNKNVIAWRLNPKLVPTFEDLAQQAFQAHLIPRPNIITLAKFSLNFFAEMWLQQKIAHSRHREQ
jgi:hypothetical protein